MIPEQYSFTTAKRLTFVIGMTDRSLPETGGTVLQTPIYQNERPLRRTRRNDRLRSKIRHESASVHRVLSPGWSSNLCISLCNELYATRGKYVYGIFVACRTKYLFVARLQYMHLRFVKLQTCVDVLVLRKIYSVDED